MIENYKGLVYNDLIRRLRDYVSDYPDMPLQCCHDLLRAAEAIEHLQAELEMEQNKHTKIQYDGREYTVTQLCNQLRKAERERDGLLDSVIFMVAKADDTVPVVHGRWLPVDEKNDAFDCSECDAMVHKRMNYCPKCGAKMDLEG